MGDAFGQALLAMAAGEPPGIVVERDDGFVDIDRTDYINEPGRSELFTWLNLRVQGRVLDIGAGAGRYAVALAAEGLDVVALDTSPGALEVCRQRGLSQTILGTVECLANRDPQPFDTFVGLGNNLGLLQSPARAVSFLAALRSMGSTAGCRLVGTMLNPYGTEQRAHLRYHDRNRKAGRLPGQVRIRIRYRNEATAWFNLLWLSPTELDQIAARAGWHVVDVLPGTTYAADLRPK